MNNQFAIRAIATLLSALMLFGMFPVYAAEVDDYICIEVENVTLDKTANNAVDGYYTVKVPIVVTQNSGFISSRFVVNHPESIELIGWENGEIFGESENLTPAVENNAIKNGIVIYYSNGTLLRNKTATGTLITLIYSVPDYIEAGDLDLTLKLMEIHKEDGIQSTLPEKINESCELVDGVISVIESGMKEPINIYADCVTVDKKDKTFDITLNFANNPGVTNLGFNVYFDESAMRYTGATYGEIFDESEIFITSNGGELFVSAFNGLEDKTGNGEFVTLTFELTDYAKPGDYDIIIDCSDEFSGFYNVLEKSLRM